MRRVIVLMVVVSMMLGATAFAGSLQKSNVSADAKWIMHIDAEKYHASQVCALIEKNKKSSEHDKGVQFLKDTLGIDPAKDILGVTLYGSSYKEGDGVVVVDAKVDETVLVSFLKKNETHEEIAYAGKTIHKWTDQKKKKPAASCFFDDKTILLAATVDLIKGGVDVLGGRSPSLAGGTSDLTVPDPSGDVILLTYARGCEGKLSRHSGAAMAGNVDTVAFAAAESDGNLLLECEVGGATAEKTSHIENMVRGMISFYMLSSGNNPDALALAQAIKIKTEGKIVSMGLSYPVAKIDEFMKAQKARQAKRAEAHKQYRGRNGGGHGQWKRHGHKKNDAGSTQD